MGLQFIHRWHLGVLALPFLFISLLCSSGAVADEAYPVEMDVKVGSYWGDVNDLLDAGDGKVLRLYSNWRGQLRVIFRVQLNGLSQSLRLQSLFKQETNKDVYTFYARTQDQRWVEIGATKGAGDFKALEFSVPSNAVINDQVTIRMDSSRHADDVIVDELVISGEVGSGTEDPTEPDSDSGSGSTPSTETTSFYPSSMRSLKGQHSDQGLEALTVQDQSGTQDTWSNYIEFSAGSDERYVGEISFATGVLTGDLTVKANYRGPMKSYQVWSLYVYDYTVQSWAHVADNENVESWAWTLLQSTLLDASRFVKDGVVTLRYESNTNVDASQFDYLEISAVTSTGDSGSDSGGDSGSDSSDPPTNDPTTGLAPGASWYWQLQGTVNTSLSAQVYDIDLFEVPETTIAELKQQGKMVICYFSAGSYEEWRPDADRFPQSALGNNLDGWPGEIWVDIRDATVRQIMVDRIALARSKGCDGVEPDLVAGYSNNNGLGLTKEDQISYNSFLADAAHAEGLTVALKNAAELVPILVDKFDFAVVEECFAYNECPAYSPFIEQNKAVLNAEYSGYSSAICTKAEELNFSTVFYGLDLDGRVYEPCP